MPTSCRTFWHWLYAMKLHDMQTEAGSSSSDREPESDDRRLHEIIDVTADDLSLYVVLLWLGLFN